MIQDLIVITTRSFPAATMVHLELTCSLYYFFLVHHPALADAHQKRRAEGNQCDRKEARAHDDWSIQSLCALATKCEAPWSRASCTLPEESTWPENIGRAVLEFPFQKPIPNDRCVAYFAHHVAANNQLLHDLIYYGTDSVYDYLLYRFGLAGNLEQIDLWATACEFFCKIWRPSSWKSVMQGAIDGGHTDMLRKIFQNVVSERYHDSSFRQASPIWHLIRGGLSFDLLPPRWSGIRHYFSDRQIEYVRHLDDPEIWIEVLRYRCKDQTFCAPVPAIVAHFDQYHSWKFLADQLIQQVADQDEILKHVSIDPEDVWEILDTCYGKSAYTAMEALIRHTGITNAQAADLLLDETIQEHKRIPGMLDRLEISLSDQDCLLLRNSHRWDNATRAIMTVWSRLSEVRYYCSDFVISDYPLGFGEEYSVIEFDNGPHPTVLQYSRPEMVRQRQGDLISAYRVSLSLKDRNSSKILEIPVDGWFIYQFNIFGGSSGCYLMQVPQDQDPRIHLTPAMISALGEIPARPKKKSARSIYD